MNNPTMLFIVGRGRSGTSLLQTILNTHPEISVAPESQFIMFLRKRYQNVKWGDDRIKKFAKDLWLEERMQNWHLDPVKLEKELLEIENPDFAKVCHHVYQNYAKTKNKQDIKIVGDKNPHYALYIGHLMKLYPDAKFIHMVRDPRDTILSYKEVNFDSDNTATLAHRWNIYNRAILNFKNKIGANYQLVTFEKLLQHPEETLTNICQFLNFEYYPEMLDFYKKEQDWEAEFRKNLKNPLDPSKAFRWKAKMTPKQVKASTRVTGELAKEFGYEVDEEYNNLFKLFHLLYARWVTFLERFVYILPLWLIAPIISLYRKMTAPKPK
jgi:hypothetical protein